MTAMFDICLVGGERNKKDGVVFPYLRDDLLEIRED